MVDDRSDVLIRVIAGHGLPGVTEPEPTSVPDDVWETVFSRVCAQRISGLAVQSLDSGWLQLSDEQATQLLAAHRDSMTWCLCVERKLVRLAEAFDAERIPFAVLKGTSVAHTMYADPGLRSFGDLDLLVSTSEYDRACVLLSWLGHVRQRPEPRPGFEVRFGKASVHKHPDDGIEVDLHRTLVLGPFGLWIDPDELLSRREPFLLGGRKLDRLDDTSMLLNVAMHASLGQRPVRLVPLRDVAQLWTAGDVDWRAIARWAQAWRLTPVLRHAFMTASTTLGMPIPPGAADLVALPPTRSATKLLAQYTSARRNQGGPSIATVRAIPGVRAKAAYAWALAFPDRSFLEARSGGRGDASYLRRWSVPVRWGRARWHGRRSSGMDTRRESV
jgi:hypothetical protein